MIGKLLGKVVHAANYPARLFDRVAEEVVGLDPDGEDGPLSAAAPGKKLQELLESADDD